MLPKLSKQLWNYILCILSARSLLCSLRIYISLHSLPILLKNQFFVFLCSMFFAFFVLNSMTSLQTFHVLLMFTWVQSTVSFCSHQRVFKRPTLGLKEFLTIESDLKMMKNVFYFMLRTLFVLEIFTFLCWIFGYVENRFDKKSMVSFNIYDVTDWIANNHNTHIKQHLKK